MGRGVGRGVEPGPMRRIAHGLPRLPLRLILLLGAVVLVLGGGWHFLRDSALVKIRDVEVIGVSSSEGPQVRHALESAARGMTTVHLDRDELEASVADFESVAGLRVQGDFPHGVTIEVAEREPVAEVDLAGQVIPVGAGGRLMRGVEPRSRLPVLHATRLAPGGRLTDPGALAAVHVLAAAPKPLRREVRRIWSSPKGLTLDMRTGPQLFFGSQDRSDAKWLATARVLAEPSSAGAVYLDVRVPERVAAGGLGSAPTVAPNSLDVAPDNTQVAPEAPATLNP